MRDQKTHDYFDEFTPHFDPRRFDFAVDYLNQHAKGDLTNLIDVGCGDGTTLHLIKEKTPIKLLVGMDISQSYLNKARRLVGCDIIQGSILDDDIVSRYSNAFDYCTLGAVIHHLIGKNRKESFQFASQCINNAIGLLKPGGCLIIFEPTYSPSFMMDLVFWIKKSFSGFTNNRIEIFHKWANIGQPVVSYYTPSQVFALIKKSPHIGNITSIIVDESRLGFIIKRVGMGIIVEKTGI